MSYKPASCCLSRVCLYSIALRRSFNLVVCLSLSSAAAVIITTKTAPEEGLAATASASAHDHERRRNLWQKCTAFRTLANCLLCNPICCAYSCFKRGLWLLNSLQRSTLAPSWNCRDTQTLGLPPACRHTHCATLQRMLRVLLFFTRYMAFGPIIA